MSLWKFENGVAGFGFLALAVMIFGQWKPTRIALAALLFGFFRALSNVYFGFPFLMALNIPGSVYNMMPYIISLVVLAFTSKKSRAPKAEGIPYDKGSVKFPNQTARPRPRPIFGAGMCRRDSRRAFFFDRRTL